MYDSTKKKPYTSLTEQERHPLRKEHQECIRVKPHSNLSKVFEDGSGRSERGTGETKAAPAAATRKQQYLNDSLSVTSNVVKSGLQRGPGCS